MQWYIFTELLPTCKQDWKRSEIFRKKRHKAKQLSPDFLPQFSSVPVKAGPHIVKINLAKTFNSLCCCVEINCGHPGQLANGWLENIEKGTALGASVIFRCYEGMTLVGHTSSLCQVDGQWRYPPPHCFGL